jgi:hypothetical protein
LDFVVKYYKDSNKNKNKSFGTSLQFLLLGNFYIGKEKRVNVKVLIEIMRQSNNIWKLYDSCTRIKTSQHYFDSSSISRYRTLGHEQEECPKTGRDKNGIFKSATGI